MAAAGGRVARRQSAALRQKGSIVIHTRVSTCLWCCGCDVRRRQVTFEYAQIPAWNIAGVRSPFSSPGIPNKIKGGGIGTVKKMQTEMWPCERQMPPRPGSPYSIVVVVVGDVVANWHLPPRPLRMRWAFRPPSLHGPHHPPAEKTWTCRLAGSVRFSTPPLRPRVCLVPTRRCRCRPHTRPSS
jgi:hypothetical protein